MKKQLNRNKGTKGKEDKNKLRYKRKKERDEEEK